MVALTVLVGLEDMYFLHWVSHWTLTQASVRIEVQMPRRPCYQARSQRSHWDKDTEHMLSIYTPAGVLTLEFKVEVLKYP